MTRLPLRISILLLLFPAFGLIAAAAARAEDAVSAADEEIRWRGPFRLRGQYPLDLPTLDVVPDDARVLPAGDVSIELFVAHSNTFELSEGFDARAAMFAAGTYLPGWDFDVDTETTRLSVRAEFGIGGRLQLGVEVPVVSHQGGFLDGPVENFHDATGFPNGDRQLRPHGEFNVDYIVGDERFTMDESQVALGDVSVRAKVALCRSTSSALSAIVDVKAPTGDEGALAGSGAWDWGVGLIGSVGGPRNAFHGGIAHYVLGQPDSYPFAIDDRTSVYAAYELTLSERWSFGIQALAATSILVDEDVLQADRERLEISFGAQRGSGSFEFSFGITENITANDNNLDITLFFAASWAL